MSIQLNDAPFSSDESSWSDHEETTSSDDRSSTPFAFRSDRYSSDVSGSETESDAELEAHKQLSLVALFYKKKQILKIYPAVSRSSRLLTKDFSC